jgi:hypothetical protein
MAIKVRPGFIRFILGASLTLFVTMLLFTVWSSGTWGGITFDFIAGRIVTTMVVVLVTGAFASGLIGAVIGFHYACANWILEGVEPPAIKRYLKVGSRIVAVVMVFFGTFHLAMANRLEPLAERFRDTAGCSNGDCYADETVVPRRNQILQESGYIMLGRWWVNQPSYDENISTNAMYFFTFTAWPIN